jgi:hypothetical protein
MNPSAKAAGLPFQLSSPIEIRDGSIFEQRSDVRPHDNGPEARPTRVCSYPDCQYFTRRQLTRRNLASIRLSRCIAVCSEASEARSAFTYREFYPTRRGVSMANLGALRFLPSAKAGVGVL